MSFTPKKRDMIFDYMSQHRAELLAKWDDHPVERNGDRKFTLLEIAQLHMQIHAPEMLEPFARRR